MLADDPATLVGAWLFCGALAAAVTHAKRDGDGAGGDGDGKAAGPLLSSSSSSFSSSAPDQAPADRKGAATRPAGRGTRPKRE